MPRLVNPPRETASTQLWILAGRGGQRVGTAHRFVVKPKPIDSGQSADSPVTPCTQRSLNRIRMECHDLHCVPRHLLPTPFSLRRYRPGDRETWLRIETAAEQFLNITPDLFELQFGTDPVVLEQRQLFLCDGTGTAIGTATAWFDGTDPRENWGRVHWVAIIPAWQGRGLAKPLLSAACLRLLELEHQRAYLMTESVRTAAIALYQKFGFMTIASRED